MRVIEITDAKAQEMLDLGYAHYSGRLFITWPGHSAELNARAEKISATDGRTGLAKSLGVSLSDVHYFAEVHCLDGGEV